jgi:hypothetical protein
MFGKVLKESVTSYHIHRLISRKLRLLDRDATEIILYSAFELVYSSAGPDTSNAASNEM